MGKNFNLSVHHVTCIELGPINERSSNGGVSSNRDIIITTDEGVIEITLFSQYLSDDDESKPLEVRL